MSQEEKKEQDESQAEEEPKEDEDEEARCAAAFDGLKSPGSTCSFPLCHIQFVWRKMINPCTFILVVFQCFSVV